MDEARESHEDRTVEYVAPAIVDYGTLVEATASNHSNDINDVPIGQPEVGGFSVPG